MREFQRTFLVYMALLGALGSAMSLVGYAAGGSPALILWSGICGLVMALGFLGLWAHHDK